MTFFNKLYIHDKLHDNIKSRGILTVKINRYKGFLRFIKYAKRIKNF